MLSITPQLESSELDDLKHRSKIVDEQLESRKNRVRSILWLSWIPILIAIIRGIGFERWGIWGGLTLLYLVVAPAIFLFIQSKTRLQAWSVRLKDEIKVETARILAEKDRILAETETLAIAHISKIKEEINTRRLEMLSIEDEIKYKRKWRWEFDDFPDILEENAKLDQLAIDKIRGIARKVELLREDRYGTSYRYRKELRPIDTWAREYRNYPWLRWRLDRMMTWEPPDRVLIGDIQGEEDIYDETEEANDKERFKEETNEPILDETEVARPTTSIQLNDSQGEQLPTKPKPNIQASLFDELSLTEKPPTEVPHQQQRLPSYRSIKISDALRNQINAKKVQIGWLGELAVIEFETKRLSTESQTEMRVIQHTSVKNDAAGYDIQSWRNDDEIYIEVKTTVGDFWSNLYFTKNEFDRMQELGKSYYLYRICKFNIDSGEGELFIYEGSKMILDTFEFNEKMYLLSEKLH